MLTIEKDFMFEINAVDGCNLNCAGCCEFSQLAPVKSYFPIELYDQHMARISSLTNGIAESTRIIGGEPLMHPDIAEFPRVARKHFPKTSIKVVTNGILLNRTFKNIDPFVQACVDTNTKVSVTVYPTVEHDVEFYDELRERGLNLKLDSDVTSVASVHEDSLYSKVQDRHWCKPQYDFKGKQDVRESFRKCSSGKFCAQLDRDGFIWKCPRPSMSKYWNAYIHSLSDKHSHYTLVSTKPNAANYADCMYIYDSNFRVEDFVRVMHLPIPFCRYCYFNDIKVDDHVKWRRHKDTKNILSEYDMTVSWDEE